MVNFKDFRAGFADGWEEYSGDDVSDDEMQLTVEADWAAFIKFRNWQISHFGNEWLALHRVYFLTTWCFSFLLPSILAQLLYFSLWPAHCVRI